MLKVLCDTDEIKQNKIAMAIQKQDLNIKLRIMKTTKIYLSAIVLALVFIFTSCDNTGLNNNEDFGILPDNFKVDIPSSITQGNLKNATLKSAQGDTLSGNEIYEMLGFFIEVGEESANIVEEIIWAIRVYGINKPMELSFISDDDSRSKNLVVKDLVEFESVSYDHGLTITDAQSEGNDDGGKAMQVFWNSDPIAGVAIIKPFNLDRNTNGTFMDAMYRVEYSAAGTAVYDETMLVSITGLPLEEGIDGRFSLETMKMFVGRKDTVVDVYGNSNHPNAYLFVDETVGFNWAFVASGTTDDEIGVAEVGLPPSDLTDGTRKAILEDYSIKQVFTEQINQWFLETWGIRPDSSDVANYLQNADAPGYFDEDGFIQAGEMPNNNYTEISSRILDLTPYKPADISELTIDFK